MYGISSSKSVAAAMLPSTSQDKRWIMLLLIFQGRLKSTRSPNIYRARVVQAEKSIRIQQPTMRWWAQRSMHVWLGFFFFFFILCAGITFFVFSFWCRSAWLKKRQDLAGLCVSGVQLEGQNAWLQNSYEVQKTIMNTGRQETFMSTCDIVASLTVTSVYSVRNWSFTPF